MNTSTPSSAARDTIVAYNHTVHNILAACTGGSQRAIDRVNTTWETTVRRGAAPLSDKLRSDLVVAGHEITGYYATGVKRLTEGSASVVQKAANLASEALGFVSARAGRVEAALNMPVLQRVAPIAMPVVRANLDFAQILAEGSRRLAARAIGDQIDQASASKPAARRARRAAA